MVEIYRVVVDELCDIDAQLGAETVLVVPYQSLKDMAEQYERLPPIVDALRKYEKFGRVLSGMILNIRIQFGIHEMLENNAKSN